MSSLESSSPPPCKATTLPPCSRVPFRTYRASLGIQRENLHSTRFWSTISYTPVVAVKCTWILPFYKNPPLVLAQSYTEQYLLSFALLCHLTALAEESTHRVPSPKAGECWSPESTVSPTKSHQVDPGKMLQLSHLGRQKPVVQRVDSCPACSRPIPHTQERYCVYSSLGAQWAFPQIKHTNASFFLTCIHKSDKVVHFQLQ